MLRHSVLHFTSNYEALLIEWRNWTPHYATLLERGNENMQYVVSLSRNRTHNLLHLQSHVCATEQRLALLFSFLILQKLPFLLVKSTLPLLADRKRADETITNLESWSLACCYGRESRGEYKILLNSLENEQNRMFYFTS